MPTEQELKNKYEEVSTKVRKLLSSELVTDEVRLIARRNGLDAPLTEVLLNEIGLVLLGFEGKDVFAKNIEMVLEINEQRAKAIAGQISETIFSQMDSSQKLESGVPTPQTKQAVPQKPPIHELLKKSDNIPGGEELEGRSLTPQKIAVEPKSAEIEELEKDLMPLRVPNQLLAPQPRVPLIQTPPTPTPPQPSVTPPQQTASQHTPDVQPIVPKQTVPPVPQKVVASAPVPPQPVTTQQTPPIKPPTQQVTPAQYITSPHKLEIKKPAPPVRKPTIPTPQNPPAPRVVTPTQAPPQPVTPVQPLPKQTKPTGSSPQPETPPGILGTLREGSKKMSIKNIIASLEE